MCETRREVLIKIGESDVRKVAYKDVGCLRRLDMACIFLVFLLCVVVAE